MKYRLPTYRLSLFYVARQHQKERAVPRRSVLPDRVVSRVWFPPLLRAGQLLRRGPR